MQGLLFSTYHEILTEIQFVLQPSSMWEHNQSSRPKPQLRNFGMCRWNRMYAHEQSELHWNMVLVSTADKRKIYDYLLSEGVFCSKKVIIKYKKNKLNKNENFKPYK